MSQGKLIKHEYNYDLLRVLATIAVITIHVNSRYFISSFSQSDEEIWFFTNFISVLSRYCVPVFLMITGGYSLSKTKNEDALYFVKKSMVKTIFPFGGALILHTVGILLYNVMKKKGLLSGLRGVASGNFYNLWYMYMICVVYLFVPMIVRWRKSVSKRNYVVTSIIMMIWAVISQATSQQAVAYSIGVVFSFMAYLLWGDMLKNILLPTIVKRKGIKCILFVICVLSVGAEMILARLGLQFELSAYNIYFSPFVVIYSSAVFLFFGLCNVTCDVLRGNNTLYIYIFHTVILHIMRPITEQLFSNVMVLEFIQIIFVGIITLVVSQLYNILWKKISTRLIVPMLQRVECSKR